MSELGPQLEDALRPGVNVDIRRTDGRVHPAAVTAVRSRLVTVEWFENGQTKGKDVDRQTLVALNPTLARAAVQQPMRRKESAASIRAMAPAVNRKLTAASLPCAPVRKEDNDLCNELTRELERAAQLSMALNKKQAAEAAATPQQYLHHQRHAERQQQQQVEQVEAEAVADLLRRYRAVVDVSDLWMTTDVRLLTRMLSTRALEDDTWLRELEDLVLVKMELLSGLRDAVNKLRKIKDSTRTFIRDIEGLAKR